MRSRWIAGVIRWPRSTGRWREPWVAPGAFSRGSTRFEQPRDVAREVRVLAAQQRGQGLAEVGSSAPFAHVVLPRAPAPALPAAHVVLVEQQVGALEERDQHAEDDEHAFALLAGELRGRLRG